MGAQKKEIVRMFNRMSQHSVDNSQIMSNNVLYLG